MPGLGETVAALTRLSKTAKRPSGARPSGVMTETAAFGPNPGELRMLSYLPTDLAPGAPLVVLLHGCTQSAEGYARGAGWLTLADRYGFAVLAPEQRQANNPNLCFNWFEPGDTARGQGEAASIRQMIAHITDQHGLDADRVFVTGLSAGGAMTSVMLAAYPEVFSAGAVIAGLPFGAAGSMQDAFKAMFQPAAKTDAAWGDTVRAASPHKGPWPRVSVWHGGADATVKPSNADAVAVQWANVHGAAGPKVDSVHGHKRLSWTAADGTVVVEQYAIEGMAHGTPLAVGGQDGSGAVGPYLIEVGISSSLEIARFWKIAGKRRPARALSEPSELNQRPEPLAEREPAFDVQGVINRALTSAGLMR